MFNLNYTYRFRNFSVVDDMAKPTSQVTELYLPARRYAQAFKTGSASVKISDGKWKYDEHVRISSFNDSEENC